MGLNSFFLITISEAIGRFHPVLVHLPIGILVMAVLFHWLSEKPKYAISGAAVRLLYLLGVAGALLASITGFLLSNSGDYEGDIVAWHMWLAIGTTAISLLVFARLVQQKKDAKYLSLFLLICLSITGHFGGSLTHGEDYLTAAWSEDGEEDGAPIIKPIADVQQAAVYNDIVQPIFESRCYNCHGAQKQKGGLRMDTEARLLEGGKNGTVIEKGNALKSELIKRLLLPREHEDHMPPKGKPQLTENQVALLHWWIAQGAPFDKKIAQLQQPPEVQPLLAALQTGAEPSRAASIIPETKVASADEKAIQALRDKGVVILPVEKEGPWLAANFVTAQFSDADAPLLLPLKQQLLWIKMNEARIGDPTLAVLKSFQNIVVLHLNHTNITDAGLAGLAGLTNLRSLSLVGTNITAKGLSALRALPKLEQVFLYGSSAALQGWPALKSALPKAKLDTGGYRLPLLASDTALVQPPKR